MHLDAGVFPDRVHLVPSDTATEGLADRARHHLDALCSVLPDRRPGSAGNREAVDHVAVAFVASGWNLGFQVFDCLDWETEGGTLKIDKAILELTPSPYGRGVTASGPIRVLRHLEDLEHKDLVGSIAVLAGELASEPLTPKAFPFYGSDVHSHIVAELEAADPAAIIAVTGIYPELCGALDPFPLIEDGDFDIPTANLRPEDAGLLFESEGRSASVEIRSIRKQAQARNVIGMRGPQSPRVTAIAHVDTKPGTPGAVDNAAGVVVLLLLAELLHAARHPDLPIGVELLVVNGEDHYAAPGELAWLEVNGEALDEIPLVVNIDGAGYVRGKSAFSTYNVEGDVAGHVDRVFGARDDFLHGPEWFQSDHAIFAMRGRPAVAITTEYVQEMLATLFHSADDTPDQVDIDLVVGIAKAIEELIVTWPV